MVEKGEEMVRGFFLVAIMVSMVIIGICLLLPPIVTCETLENTTVQPSLSGSPIVENFAKRFADLTPETYKRQKLEFFGYEFFQGFPEIKDIYPPLVFPDYRIIPGDRLLIQVTGNLVKQYEVEVDQKGQIFIPDMGVTTVWGLTLSEARKVVADFVNSFFMGSEVYVALIDLQTFPVWVVGSVGKPGMYLVSGASTLLEVLARAGGIPAPGSLRNIQLFRNGQLIASLDLYEFFHQGKEAANFRFQPGDVISVPLYKGYVGIGGEIKRPGIYEIREGTRLSGLIDIAGGVTPLASPRHIKIERIKEGGERDLLEVSCPDFADLCKPETDIILQDGDLVIIANALAYRTPERISVEIQGNVAKPGDFELTAGMTLKDLVEKAGGLLPETILDRVEIWRFISQSTRQILSVNLQKALEGDPEHNLVLEKWDIVKVYAQRDIFPEPRVEIAGEVNNPGTFVLSPGMTLRDLLFLGKEPTERAYLERAELFRMKRGELREVLPVNLKRILDGEENVELLPGDALQVYSVDWVFPKEEVYISGEVERPGAYELFRGMKLSDLIFQSGGLKKEAYAKAVELFRFQYGTMAKPVVITIDVSEWFSKEGRPLRKDQYPGDVLLKAGDRVFVRSHVYHSVIRKVTVSGEVALPGEYLLRPGETIASLLKRAGGLTEFSYPFGAVLIRERVRNQQKRMIADFVSYERQRIFEERAKIISSVFPEEEKSRKLAALDFREKALDLLEARVPEGRIIFDLDAVLQDESSVHNLLLEEGDSLTIPRRPGVVTVIGEVFSPCAPVYQPEQGLEFYLRLAGGITSRGDKENIYIIKANGVVETRNTGYTAIKEGDIIVVPPREGS